MTPDLSELPNTFSDALQTIAIAAIKWRQGERQTILLRGAPGVGKTMLARRLPSMLPALTDHERRWLGAEYEGCSISFVAREGWQLDRPFRAPHYSCSAAAMVGGGSRNDLPKLAGEVHLARFGVLFLDELPEFHPRTIERLGYELKYMHGRPLIVATALDCPCGFRRDLSPRCVCSDGVRKRYEMRTMRLMGALGRFIEIKIPPVQLQDLRNRPRCESSETWRSRLWKGA